ncbi:MAG TPA: YetF domain-containing protein, partial [Albitalea sp.]
EGSIMTIAWDDIFRFTTSPVEILVRGTLVFWLLFGLFRFVLRRDVGSVAVSDFLFLVILGDAVQNAMVGEAISVSEGALLVGTLVGWNFVVDYLSFRFPAVARLTQPRKLPLLRDGQPMWRNMRRELVTLDELKAKAREAGHAGLDEVRAIYMESDGSISVLPKK